MVAAAATSGALVTFSGLDGEGVVYDPASAGGALNDTVTLTLEDDLGAQTTQVLNLSIIPTNNMLLPPPSSTEFDDFIFFTGGITSLGGTFTSPSGVVTSLDSDFNLNNSDYDGLGGTGDILSMSSFGDFTSDQPGLGVIASVEIFLAGNGADLWIFRLNQLRCFFWAVQAMTHFGVVWVPTLSRAHLATTSLMVVPVMMY